MRIYACSLLVLWNSIYNACRMENLAKGEYCGNNNDSSASGNHFAIIGVRKKHNVILWQSSRSNMDYMMYT